MPRKWKRVRRREHCSPRQETLRKRRANERARQARRANGEPPPSPGPAPALEEWREEPSAPGCFGYVRVSTAAQTKGVSIDTQKKQLWSMVKDLGLDRMDRIFVDEEVSGGLPLFQRPEGRKLGYVSMPGSTVLMTDLDRGFRNTADFLVTSDQWRAMGVRLVVGSVNQMGLRLDTDSPSTKLVTTILAATKEYERRQRIDHVQACRRRSQEEAAAQGFDRSNMTRAPLGFRWSYLDPGDKGRVRLEPWEPDIWWLAVSRYFWWKRKPFGDRGSWHHRWGMSGFADAMYDLGMGKRTIWVRSQRGARGFPRWEISRIQGKHPLELRKKNERRIHDRALVVFPLLYMAREHLESLRQQHPDWSDRWGLSAYLRIADRYRNQQQDPPNEGKS